MDTYKTFTRAATTFEEFATAEREEVDTGLTYEEARAACQSFNLGRTADEIYMGLKMEFTRED